MKLCVFQGTFNPVHNAHIRVVKYVLEKYNFDKLLVIPAYKPPHKDYNSDLSLHRLNMARIAFENIENAEVSDIEYRKEGISYTYLTICELYEKYNAEDKIYFIIGTDAFDKIESWYQADKLKKLVKFIVFERENNFNPLRYNYLRDKGYDFIIENLEYSDISSTDIRKHLKNNCVPNKVKEYIVKNGLYKY